MRKELEVTDTTITPEVASKQPVLLLIEAGYEMVPLNGKIPITKDWLTRPPMTTAEALDRLASGRNVGVRLRPIDLVLDVDPRNGGDDLELARFQADLGIDLSQFPHVVTGSGGHHYYMTVADDFLAVGKVPGYSGLDLKAYGGQVVAPGSLHPETRKPYAWAVGSTEPWEQPRPPKSMLDLIERPKRSATSEPGKYDAEQLAEMLEAIYPEDFRDQEDWLNLMMSCHYATHGSGRDEFVQWSIGDPQYANDAGIIGRRWDSLDPDRKNGVTERLLERLWRESPVHRTPEQALLDFPDEPEVSSAVEAAETNKKGKQERLRTVIEGWAYLVRQETYIRCSDCTQWSQQQFRMLHQSAWKLSESIHEAVIKDKLVGFRKVESPVYEPGGPEFLPDGNYNIWRDAGIGARRDDALAQVFLDHVAYLFPDGEQGELLLDWLHYVVADVPVKVNFAPLIYGPIQGAGKSYIAEVVTRMLGKPNVGQAESDDLKKEYSGWAENRQLAVIEELMDVGRLEIGNRLKTMITNPDLRIRRMYRDAYTVPNRLNLLAFSNHPDALRLENRDRRWMVLHTPVEPKDDGYYARLFGLLDDERYIASIRWMLQHRTPGFSAKGAAPMTLAKVEMADLARDEVEQYLNERLRDGTTPFDFDLVRLDDVLGQIRAEFGNQPKLRGKAIKWLRAIGAVDHDRYTNADRPSYTLWSVRDHERWRALSPAARIDAWLAQYGQQTG